MRGCRWRDFIASVGSESGVDAAVSALSDPGSQSSRRAGAFPPTSSLTFWCSRQAEGDHGSGDARLAVRLLNQVR
jgi:hypothetical protein